MWISFLLKNVPLWGHASVCLSTHLLTDIWVVSTLWPLWKMLMLQWQNDPHTFYTGPCGQSCWKHRVELCDDSSSIRKLLGSWQCFIISHFCQICECSHLCPDMHLLSLSFFFFLDSSHPTEDEEESHVVLICFSLCPMRVSPTSLLLCLVTRAVWTLQAHATNALLTHLWRRVCSNHLPIF